MTNVRESRRADELKLGDWLRLDENGAVKPNEVVAVFQYPTGRGPRVHLTTQVPGRDPHSSDGLPLQSTYELVTEAELAALREQSERAQKIADIRALADWLEKTPDAPVPFGIRMQVSPGHEILPGVDVWNSGAEGMAALERLAAVMGAEIVHYDERSDATKTFGRVEYCAIAWHKDGRPAEHYEMSGWKGDVANGCGVRCACGVTYDGFDTLAEASEFLAQHIADPDGLAYTRADDDGPMPRLNVHASIPDGPAGDVVLTRPGHRVEPHTGAVTDEGLVDETPDEPVHMDFIDGRSLCGLAATTPHTGSLVWSDVTCPDCITDGR